MSKATKTINNRIISAFKAELSIVKIPTLLGVGHLQNPKGGREKMVIAILKNLATIIYVAAMPYAIFCLWYMFDGGHILVPREKSVGKLNFWPFNAFQFE